LLCKNDDLPCRHPKSRVEGHRDGRPVDKFKNDNTFMIQRLSRGNSRSRADEFDKGWFDFSERTGPTVPAENYIRHLSKLIFK